MEILFEKVHGNGNDFIVIDEFEVTVIPDDMKAKFASLYCHRRFGIGADGVLFLSTSESDDIRMRLFQPDGSEAEMCGNGLRCLVKVAHDRGYVKESCTVETAAGSIPVTMGYDEDETFNATIDMPAPLFTRKDIPATGPEDEDYLETIMEYEVHAVNEGVPHAVVIVDEIGGIELHEVGPAIRNHPTFPRGANVNFVEVSGENTLSIRTFERGVEEETYSCGTGATASAAICHRLGLVGDTVTVETLGGPLTVYLGEKVRMKGPAFTVFRGGIHC
ncbi:MAG: diaminopimelate epimerase [Methanoculleaceae archaeon]